MFRPLDGVVRQGDIFDGVPIAAPITLPQMTVSKPSKHKQDWIAKVAGAGTDRSASANFLDGSATAEVAVSVRMERAILLSRGCDIDNGRTIQFAPVRSLTRAGDDRLQTAIVEGRVVNCHFLPPDVERGLPASYVDFRQITTLKRDSLDKARRVAGLTKDGLLQLYLGQLRHITGMEVDLNAKCTTCGATVPAVQHVSDEFRPLDDY